MLSAYSERQLFANHYDQNFVYGMCLATEGKNTHTLSYIKYI